MNSPIFWGQLLQLTILLHAVAYCPLFRNSGRVPKV